MTHDTSKVGKQTEKRKEWKTFEIVNFDSSLQIPNAVALSSLNKTFPLSSTFIYKSPLISVDSVFTL
jgi:hypothetical protein